MYQVNSPVPLMHDSVKRLSVRGATEARPFGLETEISSNGGGGSGENFGVGLRYEKTCLEENEIGVSHKIVTES